MALKVKQNNIKRASRAKKTAPQEHEARFIADEDGALAHVTDALAARLSMDAAALKAKTLSAILEFSDPDSALRTAGMFGAAPRHYIDALNEGVHKVRLYGKDGETVTSFRFDKVTAADGRRFIVAVEVRGKDAPAALPDNVLSLLAEPKPAPPAAPGSAAKITAATDEGELRHFLNMSNDLMAVSHLDGIFSRVNPCFNTVSGYTDDELRTMTFLDLVHAEDRPQVRNCLVGLRDETGDGQIIDFEARIVAKDGTTHWMEWRQKRSGKTVYTVGRDMTAVKEHEAALLKKELMLGEAQAIGHMGHWRWAVGAEDLAWSDEIYNIFGVGRDGFVPSLDNINALIHRRDVSRMMQAFQRAIIEQNNYEMDFRVIRPDDEVRYVRCEGKCELDDEGEVVALFGIMQDITERTIYERQLREAKDAAERAYAAKSQFLANMSHELRTPLNAIIGFSEMMQRQLLGPIGTEKYIDYIAGIRESGEHLLDLISDILDMSKIEAGKYELDLEELSAAKIIRLAVHMMEGRAQDARVKVGIEVENEDLQIICDRRAFMQILLNLLSNAVKFTRPGGDVRVECRTRDDFVIVKVHDTGIGIPANKIASITNPFEQAASHYTREHEGTGLGLAITKELIELHGGVLHIESTVGVGTTVTIKLPVNAYEQMKKRRN